MARKNSSLVMFVLVMLLTGLGVIYLITKQSSQKTTTKTKLFPWLMDDVLFIQRWVNLTNTIEYTAFQREGGEWKMVSPLREKVHPELFHRFLKTFAKLQSEQSFVITNNEAWSSFGFTPYQYRFVLSNTSGEAYSFDVGTISVGQNYYYLRVNNKETNYQVYTFNMIDIIQPQGAYRWPDIFDIPFDSLKQVEFFFKGQKVIKLSNIDTQWVLLYPEKRLLTNFAIKSMLLDLYPIQLDHFVTTSVSPAVLRQYKLITPLYGVIFISSDRSNTLWISEKEADGFSYAYSYERQGVFVVSTSEVSTKFITQASQLRR